MFVTAHMAAHVKNVKARNGDYWCMASKLEAQAPLSFLPDTSVSNSPSTSCNLLISDAMAAIPEKEVYKVSEMKLSR